jgi:hypothetical protein
MAMVRYYTYTDAPERAQRSSPGRFHNRMLKPGEMDNTLLASIIP